MVIKMMTSYSTRVSLLLLIALSHAAVLASDQPHNNNTDFDASKDDICKEDVFAEWQESIGGADDPSKDVMIHVQNYKDNIDDVVELQITNVDEAGLLSSEETEVIVTSLIDKDSDVLLMLEDLDKEDYCSTGSILPSWDHLYILNVKQLTFGNYTTHNNKTFRIGKCHTWTSFHLEKSEVVKFPYVPSSCGCFIIRMYAIINDHTTFDKKSLSTGQTMMCINTEQNSLIDNDYASDEDSTEVDDEEEDDTNIIGPRVSALMANPSNHTMEKKPSDLKTKKRDERVKQRQEKRKKMRQRMKKQNRQKVVESNTPVSPPMCPKCPGYRKWMKRHGRTKHARRKHRRNGRKRKGRTHRVRMNARVAPSSSPETSVMEEKQPTPSLTTIKLSRSSLNITQEGQNNSTTEEEEEDFTDVVNELLGIDNNSTDTAHDSDSQEVEKDTEEQNTGVPGATNGRRKNAFNKKRRKMARKQIRKSKKSKQGRKRVSLGERTCCKQGIQTKKLYLYLNTNESLQKQEVCNSPARELLIWVPHKFKTSTELCRLRFYECCNQFTLEWLDNWKRRRAERKARRQIKRLQSNKMNSPPRHRHKRRKGSNK